MLSLSAGSFSSISSNHRRDGSDQQQCLLHTWSGHSLTVTDVHVGVGSWSLARVASVSADRTARLWDLGTGDCLYAFLFDQPLTAVIMDTAEFHLYAGCANGDIARVSLFDVAVVTPPGSGERLQCAPSSSAAARGLEVKLLTHHKSRVLSLSLSFDGSALASGSEDGEACVWDSRSRQVIRSLAHKSGVTNVAFAFAPYLATEQNEATFSSSKSKTPIWPQLQKRLREEDNNFNQSKEVVHIVLVT